MNFGDLAKSLELMKEAYGIEPSFQTLGSLIEVYQAMGLYKEAATVTEDYLKDHPARPSIYWFGIWTYLLQKEYDQALAEIERGFLLDPAPGWGWSTLRAIVHLFKGDLADAEKGFIQVIAKETKEDRAGARMYLISLYLLQGRFGRAREDA